MLARRPEELGADLRALQEELRRKVLALIGGLPAEKSALNARVTGSIAGDGYRIDKLLFESLPGVHVAALVYVPDGPPARRPAASIAVITSITGRGVSIGRKCGMNSSKSVSPPTGACST